MNPLAKIVWEGVDPDEIRSGVQLNRTPVIPGWEKHFSVMIFHPEPEHHNTKLTCRVIFQESIQTESTVILEVRHAPKILNISRCLEWGDELTCMCVSSGVPLPQIYWTILDGEYYSAFSAENTISIITVSIASSRNLNATIECVSKNLIGWAEMKIQVHNRAEKPKGSQDIIMRFTFSVIVPICIYYYSGDGFLYKKMSFILLKLFSFFCKLEFVHPLDILYPFSCCKCHLRFLFDCHSTKERKT